MPRFQSYAVPRADLGEAFYEYLIEQRDFVGIRALALAPVQRPAAKFPKILRANWLRNQKVERAAGSAFRRVDYAVTDDSYACKEYAIEHTIDDTELARYAYDFDLALAGLTFATQVILRQQEDRIAKLLFNTNTWSGSNLFTDNSANPWSNPATDVLAQTNAARNKIRLLTGQEPNKILMSIKNRDHLLNNDDFRSHFFSSGAVPSQDTLQAALAQWLGVEEVLVGKAVVNLADEGQNASLSNIWSDTYVMLLKAAPQGESLLMYPCVGRTLLWEEVGPGMVRVEQYRDETVASEVYRVRQHVDEKVIDPSYAHLMKVA